MSPSLFNRRQVDLIITIIVEGSGGCGCGGVGECPLVDLEGPRETEGDNERGREGDIAQGREAAGGPALLTRTSFTGRARESDAVRWRAVEGELSKNG